MTGFVLRGFGLSTGIHLLPCSKDPVNKTNNSMMDTVEQIKERISVHDLISEYLKLEKAGTNYKALCPFHNEKTPSFMINPERNFWYCFGCQRGGDVFSFLMEMEGLDFRAAMEQLAQKAGVEIIHHNFRGEKGHNSKKRIFAAVEAATKFFQDQLARNPRSGLALKYLHDRKISDEQIGLFRVGYAPVGWSNLLDFLASRGFLVSEIEKAGLSVRKEKANGGRELSKNDYYDRFRDRIMFPVFDVTGKPVGFSARLMPDSDQTSAKYINTPQTVIYDKSNVLFGLFQAKTEIKKKNSVIVVEGNLDVISSFSADIGNVVAISGTALTPKHADILKRYSENLKLCFDMDQAGYAATTKSVRVCLGKSLDVEIITLPEGFKDVNDLVIRDPRLWHRSIGQSKGVMDYFFETVFSRYDSNDIKGKKNISRELLNIIKDIADPIERFHWLKKLSALLDVDEEVLTKVLEKVKLRKEEKIIDDQGSHKLNKIPRKVALEMRLVGLLSLFRSQLGQYVETFDVNLLGQAMKEIWSIVANNEKTQGKEKEINQCETVVRFHYDEKEGFVENDIDPEKEWGHLVVQLKEESRKENIKKIAQDIKRAERENDEEALKTLMENLKELSG